MSLLAAVPVFLLATALYVTTLLPDVGFWDTAEWQAIGPVLGIAHPTGYPTYTLVAWAGSVLLAPFGNEAYRADLLSALCMGGAAALLGVRLVMATRRWPVGLAAGLALALTPLAWTWGVRADPHTLHALLAALLLVLLGAWQSRHGTDPRAGRWLVAAAAVYGLALGNHALTLLLAPGIAVFVLSVAPRILWLEWRLVLRAALVLLLTVTLVYLYLPLRSTMDPPLDYADPQTWDRFWYVVLGQQFQGAMAPLPAPADLVSAIWDELVLALGPVAGLALAGLLLGLLRHPRLTLLGLLWFGCTWLFAMGYPNAAIERYYLVPLLVACLWAGLALDALSDAVASLVAGQRARRVAWLAAVVSSALVVAAMVVPASQRLEAQDASGDRRGRAYLDAAFDTLEPDGVVVSWWSYSTPLWYGQHVEGRRPDLTIIDDRDVLDDGWGTAEAAIDAHLDERPVYVIRLDRDLPALARRYVLTPVTDVPVPLYRVERRAQER